MNPTPRKPRACFRQVATHLGVLAAASGLWAQTTPPATAPEPTPAPAAKPVPGKPDDTIQLTPFQVDASQDKGYFAENTLAGSRMRTNISDLGAAISVVTLQQMQDTASVDVNDVFRYELNTEGSSTYTPAVQSLRNDGVIDQNSGVSVGGGATQTNATANRVRGIGVPSFAINYYPSISQVPMDSYNIQSLEISRGPNSMLFGMGSPAGIVNQSTAQAQLNRTTNTVTLRTDQNGSFRSSFSFNRGLIDDKLAIYGAALYDDRAFERKPSYDTTRRIYGAITARPFSKTTIRANVEAYNNDNRRPNTLTPRDFITPWVTAGKPTYDPLTKTITRNGQVSGPYILDAASPNANQVRDYVRSRPNYNPALWNAAQTTYNGISIFGEGALTNTNSVLYVPGITWVTQSRATMQIQGGQLVNWFQPLGNQQYRTTWGTATNPTVAAPTFPTAAAVWANPTWSDVYNRYFTNSTGWQVPATIAGSAWKHPGVTSRDVYDWENININQANFGKDENKTYNIELEQELLPDLHLSAGYFKQDYRSISNYTIAQLNVATLFVDTNPLLPDGTKNPLFGKPYVEDFDPDQAVSTDREEHYRAMLAYTPDFRQKDGWLKWLGHHQILGLYSKQDSETSYTRRRLHYINSTSAAGKYRYLPNQNPNADGSPSGYNRQGTSLRRAFYLAGPNDPQGVVTSSSGEWNYLNYTGDIRVYDYQNSRFDTVNMTTEFIDFDNGTAANQREIESLSAGMTNYFWEDRLITTFGVRSDDYRARTTTTGAINRQELSNGKDVNYLGQVVAAGRPVAIAAPLTNQEKWVNGVYQTDRVFDRWNRWDELSGTTSTLGGVLKPFRNWSGIDGRAENGSLLWEFVRDFGVSFNKSDNFNAPTVAQVDPFGNALPKPEGEGKDYGFQFSLFRGKLFARVNWFEQTNVSERTNPGTALSRLTSNMDTTIFRGWARTIALINMGMDPTLPTFGTGLSAAQETAVQAAVEPIWKQAYNYYSDIGTLGATRDAEGKGVELQINYNPTPNWTMKLTGAKQTTTYRGVLKEYDPWYKNRLAVWQTSKALDYLKPEYRQLVTYTRQGGRQVDLTNFLTSYGYADEVRLDDPFGNYNPQNYYDSTVAPQAALSRDLEGQSAPGQRRYRWSYLTNYNFTGERLRGFSVGGSERWEDKAVIGYYGRASGANGTLLDSSDTSRPIYDDANYYTDFWIGYTRRMMSNKVRMKLQLNVNNVFEGGGLQATAVNFDGTPYSFRIVDPRQYVLTATFEF